MNYSEARELIKDGDIISVKRKKGSYNILHNITTFVTRTPYYHSAIAIWMSYDNMKRRLMIVEAANSKRRVVSLSSYSDHDIDVIECPINFSKVVDDLLEKSGSINYGMFDFVSIGIKESFGLPQKDHKGEVCSEMVAKTLIDGGFPMLDSLISPGKLYNSLVTDFKCKIRCNITPDIKKV